jgi:hypothetical protein
MLAFPVAASVANSKSAAERNQSRIALYGKNFDCQLNVASKKD